MADQMDLFGSENKEKRDERKKEIYRNNYENFGITEDLLKKVPHKSPYSSLSAIYGGLNNFKAPEFFSYLTPAQTLFLMHGISHKNEYHYFKDIAGKTIEDAVEFLINKGREAMRNNITQSAPSRIKNPAAYAINIINSIIDYSPEKQAGENADTSHINKSRTHKEKYESLSEVIRADAGLKERIKSGLYEEAINSSAYTFDNYENIGNKAASDQRESVYNMVLAHYQKYKKAQS